jgi:hypothetical protein
MFQSKDHKKSRRSFLSALGGGLLVATFSPGSSLEAIAQEAESKDLIASAEPVKSSDVYTLFKSKSIPLESKVFTATAYSERDPQGFLEILDKYSNSRKNPNAIRLMVNYSLDEDVCHMRHLAGYFALRANRVETLKQLTQTAENSQDFFQRIYAIELLGLSNDRKAIAPLLSLLDDKDPFIGAEAAMALEKTVLAGSRRDKMDAQEAMYEAMIQQKNEHKTYPIRRNHIAWAYRDLFSLGKLKNKLKKDVGQEVFDEITHAISTEGEWTYRKNWGLDRIYNIWKKQGKSGLKIQGSNDEAVDFITNCMKVLKEKSKKSHHFITTFTNGISVSNLSKNRGGQNSLGRGIIERNATWIKKGYEDYQTLGIIHEARHEYTYSLGEKSDQHRGEAKSEREETLQMGDIYGNLGMPKEKRFKSVITNILCKKHWINN